MIEYNYKFIRQRRTRLWRANLSKCTNVNGGEERVIYPELSYKVMGLVFEVFNALGYGYQEKYYQRAIATSLKEHGLPFKEQVFIPVQYHGTKIGAYFLDFLIEEKVVLELKQADRFARNAIEQIYAYLKATRLKLGILIIFTKKGVRFKRILNIR